MSEIKVSIVTPTYNRASTIGRSVESVLAQTYSNFEYIIVDDGSSDNTESVVRSFSDARIQYHKMPRNQGQSAAMNVGARLATGELITFLDSDDEYYPTRIEKQVQVFRESKLENLGVVTCGRTDVNHQGKEYFTWVPNLRGNILTPMIEGARIGGGPPFLMLRRSVFERGIFFDETLKSVKELDFLIKVFLAGFTLDFVAEPLLRVYHHEDERTFNYRNAVITRMTVFERYPQIFSSLPVARKFLYRTLLYGVLSKDHAVISQVEKALGAHGESLKPKLWRVIMYIPQERVRNAVVKLLTFLCFR